MLFNSKKKRSYQAYLLLSEYMRSSFMRLQMPLFDPEDEEGTLCAAAAMVVYMQIYFDMHYFPYECYKANFDENPELKNRIENAYDELIYYFNCDDGKDVYEILELTNTLTRANRYAFKDRDLQYCRLINAIGCYIDSMDIYCHYDTDKVEIDQAIYRILVAEETIAVPIFDQVKKLILF